MSPVERRRVEVGRDAGRAEASTAATSSWSASPAGPVAAFAQPLVEMIASAQP